MPKAIKKKVAPAKKATATKRLAAPNKSASAITSIKIRMYRAGTGDFFLLQFKAGGKVQFNMMIDCGCIKGGKETFAPLLKDLKKETNSVIDLLVVTHEHADHINGFQYAADVFDTIQFKKVWFAWTEDKSDKTANTYRKKYTKTKMALAAASQQLQQLSSDKYYDKLFNAQLNSLSLIKGQNHFIESITQLNQLNSAPMAANPSASTTMADLLKEYKVIKPATEVEFLSPGDICTNLVNAAGIRFFVLGPPRDLASLSLEGKIGGNYDKRAEPSSVDFALTSALTSGSGLNATVYAFASEYEEQKDVSGNWIGTTVSAYQSREWRKIDYDWLYSAGGMALRLQQSINNTSLALAIQFEQSEKVLLFPGDAEYGNWQSWHNGLQWTIKDGGASKKVDADYLLGNTVFYKVGHHLSQNGTATKLGMDKMVHEELVAMATLDFKKINSGWLNTMPNDLLGADLIDKTKGKLYFLGDSQQIMKNIKTDRVTIKQANENTVDRINKAFDGEVYIDYEVNG